MDNNLNIKAFESDKKGQETSMFWIKMYKAGECLQSSLENKGKNCLQF